MFHPQGPTFLELAIQALSSTERGYDLLAPKFDLTPFRTPDALLQIAAAAIGPTGSINAALDVCCGTGAAMRWLRPLCRERVVGVDRSLGMLLEAQRRLNPEGGDAALHFIHADALALPFREAFDVVTCFGAFGHFLTRERVELVDAVVRALRPGGRFVCITAPRPSPRTSRYWAARAFNAAMHVRNAIWRPPFIMYYLTFLLPEAERLLRAQGCDVEVRQHVFPEPYQDHVLLIATRR